MIKDYFLNKVLKAADKAGYTDLQLSVEKPKNPDFGDFAVNVSSLARVAKKAPPLIAQEIADNMDLEVSIVGGFINFKTSDVLLSDLVEEIFTKRENFGKPEKIEKEKILLEYVSANPTGPFHIGHGRWAAMGSALANLLSFYGHEVYQEFYINDAGSQIQKLGNSLLIRVKQELGEDADFPTDEEARKNYYTNEYLIPVAKKFLSENEATDDIQVLSDFAKKEMEALQQALLENFKVKFDNFYSEQALHDSGKVDESVKKLEKSGKIYENEGAKWFKSSEYGDDQDRVIKKADGTNTYLTADIAYHIDKLERGYDRLINIWGADHHGYVARVKASIEALGYDPNKLEVLLGQLVNLVIKGEQVRMGKRKNMITLDDLIEEVGVDATRFWMTMRNIDTTLEFDVELAKTASDENPVFYVQYAHARACSIMRNVLNEKIDTESGEKIPALMSEEEFYNFDKSLLPLTMDTARKLVLKLEEYKSIIEYSAQNRTVYTLCRYVQELAGEFHSFYTLSRVISDDNDLMKARLSLVWAVRRVLNNALDLIGVNAPERM